MDSHYYKSQGCCCKKYLDLLSKVTRLEEENMRLKAENNRLRNKSLEKPFGVSTPSSKQLIKPSTPETTSEEVKRRMGGAKVGHCGHGRKPLEDCECEIEELLPLDVCPCCGEKLNDFQNEEETRDVIECEINPIHYKLIKRHVYYCPNCKKQIRRKIPGVIPKCIFSNALLSKVAVDHYFYGIRLGTISRQLNIRKSSLINAMENIADILKPTIPYLEDILRSSFIKYADETSWRTDGKNGYTWIFKAGNITLFKCEDTRSSIIPKSILLNDNSLTTGYLMTDRYGGYNFYSQHIFCFEHLKRDVLKILDDNPKSKECKVFVDRLIPLLCEAMKFPKTFDGNYVNYMVRASILRSRIENEINQKYKEPSVLNIQEIFQRNESHLWGWTTYPKIPVENNTAERAVRPLVVARKISHGSQSVKGRETRSVLMSIIHTLANCCDNFVEKFKDVLDAYADNKSVNIAAAFFKDLPICVSAT